MGNTILKLQTLQIAWMTRMAKTREKSRVSRRPAKSRKVTKKGLTNHKKARPKTSSGTTISRMHRQPTSDATYIFECTRQGCGYRIPREEKAEQGSIRFDLKCPKCHNREF